MNKRDTVLALLALGAARFSQLLRSEIDKWRRVVQESKLRPD